MKTLLLFTVCGDQIGLGTILLMLGISVVAVYLIFFVRGTCQPKTHKQARVKQRERVKEFLKEIDKKQLSEEEAQTIARSFASHLPDVFRRLKVSKHHRKFISEMRRITSKRLGITMRIARMIDGTTTRPQEEQAFNQAKEDVRKLVKQTFFKQTK